MPPVTRNDPYPGHNFQVVITGISPDGSAVSGAFSEITGLEIEVHPIEYRNGNEGLTTRKLPGLVAHPELQLKRGVTGHTLFWDWIRGTADGQLQRADGSIILQDENQQEVMRWNFTGGWACKVTGPSLNAATSEVSFETVHVCVNNLTLAD
jgi:phage tail-like protein